jgi:hypothetical protein
VFALILSGPARPLYSLTADYATTAQALAEVGWHDYYGYYWDSDIDFAQDTNNQSHASAYYDRIQYMGNIGISALASASIEPNEVILATRVAGSYKFEVGWELMDYFYQDANSTIEGWVQITEFPVRAPCRLRIDISFPEATWTGLWAWQVYIESSLDYFIAGRDEFGDYGFLSGAIDAYAGEQIYVFLGIAGRGYADHEIGDALGYGTLTINAALEAIAHLADLNSDGRIDFHDFALLSSQWLRQGCEDANTTRCRWADLNQSGEVDANDLDLFAQYWLLPADPNQTP